MKAIILAAGYGTRLQPLTIDCPKPLLKIAGKPMIEYVLDSLTSAHSFECVYVVTNGTFAAKFQEWMDRYRTANGEPNIVLVSNQITDTTTNLGAVHNLHLVLTDNKIDDDIVVVAADNLFSHSLDGFIQFSRQKNAPVVAIYDVANIQDGRKYSSIELNGDGRITFFKEKPKNPKSNSIGIALYYYPKSCLSLISEYIAERYNHDQPGRLVEWMHSRTAFYTWRVPGLWFDIGTKEAFEEADRFFAKVFQSNA